MAKKKWYSNPYKVCFLLLAVAGVVGVCTLFAGGAGAAGRAEEMQNNIFAADEPLHTLPREITPGLVLLTAEQVVRTPIADGFQWPVGTRAMGMMYDAQPFAAENPQRGGYHNGQDLNGIGGENTDVGEPVCAAARGLVLYSGEPHASWGNVVVLAHRLPGSDRIIQTLYAHLNERLVRPGQLVGRGQRIGSIGTANGNYLAHLHFEAIESLCNEAGMPGYHPNDTMNRLNPAKLIADHPAPNTADPYEQVRRLIIRENAHAAPTSTTSSPSQPGTIQLQTSQFLK